MFRSPLSYKTNQTYQKILGVIYSVKMFIWRVKYLRLRHCLRKYREQICLQFEKIYSHSMRWEYLPNLMSEEMLSHPGGWDMPIPEVIHLWRHRTSMPNNVEKSCLGCVLDIFCTFEKNNQTQHWGRDEGIPFSCPRFATFKTLQAASLIANLGHSDGIPSSLPQCGVLTL